MIEAMPESENPAPQAEAPAPSRRAMNFLRPKLTTAPRQGLLFQLGLVIGVAFVLATLFTAWTPGQFSGFPVPPAAAATIALRPSPTFPPGAPTPTLRNPNLVGIVAGHWKNDSGAVCPDGLKEVDLNLQIATRVQKLLVEAGYQVDLLHEFDPRLTNYQAAALVSIHNDSCDFIENATGFKVASALATRHPEKAALLTACLRSRYASATGLPLHSTSVTPDMTSYHAFGEIQETTPAAIIETGFMNLDRQLLTERTDVVAFGVAQGILCYLRNEVVAPPSAAPTIPSASPAAPTANP